MPLVLDADEAAASADLERRLQADVRQLSDLALEYEVRQRLASIRNGAPSTGTCRENPADIQLAERTPQGVAQQACSKACLPVACPQTYAPKQSTTC